MLLLFVLDIEKILIMITSLHRDYVSGSWAMLPGSSLIHDWLISTVIFIGVLGAVHAIRTGYRRRLVR